MMSSQSIFFIYKSWITNIFSSIVDARMAKGSKMDQTELRTAGLVIGKLVIFFQLV